MRRNIPTLAVVTAVVIAGPKAIAQIIPGDQLGFTEYVATQLRKEVGQTEVSVKGPLTLGFGELQLNLDRIFVYCRSNPGACQTEIHTYVKGAVEAHRDRTAPPKKEAVRLVVRSTQYIQAAQTGAGPSPPRIQARPFVEGLVLLPALDSPRTIRIMSEKDNVALGLTAQEVFDLGAANLRRELRPLTEIAKAAGRGQIGQLVGDAFHSSRLALHDTWAPLANAQNGTLIVAAPATDAVLYIGEDTTVAIDALRTLVRNVLARAPNRLSNILLRWRENGWEVVQE